MDPNPFASPEVVDDPPVTPGGQGSDGSGEKLRLAWVGYTVALAGVLVALGARLTIDGVWFAFAVGVAIPDAVIGLYELVIVFEKVAIILVFIGMALCVQTHVSPFARMLALAGVGFQVVHFAGTLITRSFTLMNVEAEWLMLVWNASMCCGFLAMVCFAPGARQTATLYGGQRAGRWYGRLKFAAVAGAVAVVVRAVATQPAIEMAGAFAEVGLRIAMFALAVPALAVTRRVIANRLQTG